MQYSERITIPTLIPSRQIQQDAPNVRFFVTETGTLGSIRYASTVAALIADHRTRRPASLLVVVHVLVVDQRPDRNRPVITRSVT